MTPRLHVMLGAGGVGKTTLAAGYALALARQGRKVGLLGIDPSRRLQGALGLELGDAPLAVPGAPSLHAALLRPEHCMRRWAEETCASPEAEARLTENAFFLALADRLATATDLLAAVRVAEWAERDRELDDLVVDTAPGLDAIEFLRRPQRLTAFLEGRLVMWLRSLSAADRSGPLGGVFRGGARRVVGGLARIGGARMLIELADFASLAHGLFEQMLGRVELMQRWLHAPETQLVLVTAVRDDAARGAEQMVRALLDVGLAPSAVIMNRAMPPSLGAELAALQSEALAVPPEAQGLLRYAAAYAAMEAKLARELAAATGHAKLARVPASRGLDLDPASRLSALADVGEALRRQFP